MLLSLLVFGCVEDNITISNIEVINIPEEISVDIDEQNLEQDLTRGQLEKIIETKSELQE